MLIWHVLLTEVLRYHVCSCVRMFVLCVFYVHVLCVCNVLYFMCVFFDKSINPTNKKNSLLSAMTAMWSMPVVLTETENENDSANQNYVAKMMLQK